MKNMLMVYPNNFLQGAMGTNNRVAQLVSIFHEIGFQIDYFAYENFSENSSFADFDKQNSEGLIRKLYLYDMSKGYKNGECEKDSKLHIFSEKVKAKLGREREHKYLQDWVPAGAQRYFTDILKENEYDVIILFYTYFANLLKDKDIKAKKVYFMEDCMFLQQYSWDKDTVEGVTVGKLLDEEIERLSYFDEIFCISYDEKIFYEKVVGKNIHFFPHLLPDDVKKVQTPVEKRRWDVFFIGFNNPFNLEGLNWFLDEVYPKLDNGIKVLLAGSVTKNIETKYQNIDIIPFIPDLDEIYEDVKIVVCPMFRGTGMKIKVVEAMSKGVPVVCNERGTDGFPDKNMCGCLVTQDAEEFAGYINRLLEDRERYKEATGKMQEYYNLTFQREKYVHVLKEVLL